jgi:hypothetical protein
MDFSERAGQTRAIDSNERGTHLREADDYFYRGSAPIARRKTGRKTLGGCALLIARNRRAYLAC